MNKSVELIKSEIYEVKSNLQKFTDLSKKEPENEAHSFYVTYFTNRLTILQQIKSELEAWEVCKKYYHINKYEDINKGRDKKRFDITIWLNTENCDFKSCASYEECLKVKNALEVEDES